MRIKPVSSHELLRGCISCIPSMQRKVRMLELALTQDQFGRLEGNQQTLSFRKRARHIILDLVVNSLMSQTNLGGSKMQLCSQCQHHAML